MRNKVYITPTTLNHSCSVYVYTHYKIRMRIFPHAGLGPKHRHTGSVRLIRTEQLSFKYLVIDYLRRLHVGHSPGHHTDIFPSVIPLLLHGLGHFPPTTSNMHLKTGIPDPNRYQFCTCSR